MGASNVKEALYQAIECSDEQLVAKILKEHVELLNSPITSDCNNTALTRAVWRNDKKIVTLLIGMGCRVDYAGPKGITPLMWAAKRGHIAMAELLLQNGAKLLLASEDDLDFTALEMAIVMGQYEMCLFLLQQDLTQLEKLQGPEEYQKGAKGKYVGYCDYQMFLDHLRARIPLDACPNFFQKPKAPQLEDPVIDPRETWSQFLKRNIEFEEPPMVERAALPPKMQPQNRFFGRMRSYINGKSPYSANVSETGSVQGSSKVMPEVELKDNKSVDGNQKGNESFDGEKLKTIQSENTLQKKKKNATYDSVPKVEGLNPNLEDNL